jgi:prepilin-type processing-associated H-X9-DG protein
VQKVREAANRMTCSNNLKQLGLALHNHHDTYGYFPPAREQIYVPGQTPDPLVHSWTPRVLPYIEQDNIYKLYRFDRNWDNAQTNDANPDGPIKRQISTFVCPSAPPPNNRLVNRGALDYVATTELTRPQPFATPALYDRHWRTGDPQWIGTIGTTQYNATTHEVTPCKRGIAAVTDGTSNTMMLAECAGRNRRFILGREVSAPEVPEATWTNGPWANPNTRINIGGFDPSWRPGQPLPANGPCVVNCINDKEIYAFHSGGANVVFGDGSVRFLKQTITVDIVLSLLTRARGETVAMEF